MAQVDADVANIIGGPEHASPGAQMGYSAYAAINALKESMQSVHYAGPGDTDKLIEALANLKSHQSADFPGGDLVMDPNDHQGRMTEYISQIDGQQENILSTTPVEQVPAIGTCSVR
jgi:ABC-type branched-subunit amino acid transport system substrate-binding protein